MREVVELFDILQHGARLYSTGELEVLLGDCEEGIELIEAVLKERGD